MGKDKDNNGEETIVASNKLIVKNVDGLQEKLSSLKSRLERGERLSVTELEALNRAIEVTEIIGAAW